MQNEQDQQMRIKFGNTPAGLCHLCFKICFVGYQLTPDTSSYAHFGSNCHLHCDCESPRMRITTACHHFSCSYQSNHSCRQLILFAGVSSVVLKSLHTGFHQIVTAIICSTMLKSLPLFLQLQHAILLGFLQVQWWL